MNELLFETTYVVTTIWEGCSKDDISLLERLFEKFVRNLIYSNDSLRFIRIYVQTNQTNAKFIPVEKVPKLVKLVPIDQVHKVSYVCSYNKYFEQVSIFLSSMFCN